MNAIELFHSDGKSAKAFYCEKCRIVRRTKEEADQCCIPPKCSVCGSDNVRPYHTICDSCDNVRRRAREAERFEKAEKVTEWGGAIFCDGLGYNDGYFSNLDDLEDWLACYADESEDGKQPDRPEYVWTCDNQSFCQLDYGNIIENATQEAYEDWDAGQIVGEKELTAAIEAFNEANKHHVCWHPNYKRALLMPPQPK